MSRIKGTNTKPELQLRSMLHSKGYRFRVHKTNLPGKPDIVLRKYKTVVFVHGCFWHRHKGCKFTTTPKTRTEFWNQKFQRTMERDLEAQEKLSALGWKVIVVWECELKRDPQSVLSNIDDKLQKISVLKK